MTVIFKPHTPTTQCTWVLELRTECDALRARSVARCPDLLDAYHALEFDLITLVAMCARARAASRCGRVPALAHDAVALKADEVEQRLRELQPALEVGAGINPGVGVAPSVMMVVTARGQEHGEVHARGCRVSYFL